MFDLKDTVKYDNFYNGTPLVTYIDEKNKMVYILPNGYVEEQTKNSQAHTYLPKDYPESSAVEYSSVRMNYQKLFIGNDPHETCFDGNTILLKIAPLTYYIVAGWMSKFFTTKEEVIEFHSPMGNSDVPMPYAVTNNYIYLPIEGKYTKGHIQFENPFMDFYNDQLYDWKPIESQNEVTNPLQKKRAVKRPAKNVKNRIQLIDMDRLSRSSGRDPAGYSLVELRGFAVERGVSKSGTKSDIVARLQ